MMMMRGRGGRGMVTSHSDSKLRAGEDVEIQLSCDSLAQLRRQQTARPVHLRTFHCLHPPPTPPPPVPAATAAAAGELGSIFLFILYSATAVQLLAGLTVS